MLSSTCRHNAKSLRKTLGVLSMLMTLMRIAMTDQQIRDLYDSNPNMTLRELSRITGLDIYLLKLILMRDSHE